MAAGASSSHHNPQQRTNPTDLWKTAAGGAEHDLTWEQLYYVEKNTFLEFGDEDELGIRGKPLRRVHSDSSLSTLSNGSLRGAFTPGIPSTASNATNSAPQPRWYHGCFMKYRMGACTSPDCTYVHDLDGKETASFIAWTQRESHVVFRSDRSDSSVHPGACNRESRDLGDDSDVSSDENALDAPLDSSNHCDGHSKTRGYQDLAQQLRQQFKDCPDDATLAACLPCDSAGQPTSIGSTLHAQNRCKPCRHKMASQPCADGLWCLYCHMDHGLCTSVGMASQQLVTDGKSKARPCKGKRDRYRKHVSRISEQIMADPFSWSAETMAIPPSIECNPELKRKFLARMAVIAEHARTRAPRAAASSSGAMGTTMLPPISSGEVISSNVVSATAAAGDGQHCSEATELIKRGTLVSL
mmetsp:Transcript_31181/g.61222  ORF Transcript_31181/g.61222 Transcript_31181/m.61222 type:complete len:413 (-) Transcript_31181:107-1345(-)